MTTPDPSLAAATYALPADPAGTGPEVTQRILARTQATQRKLAPSIVLVGRAMREAGRSFTAPVAEPANPAPLSLKAEKTLEALKAGFAEDEAGANRVAATLARYQGAADAVDAVATALEGAGPSEPQVQALKEAAFFLSRFHETVKDDMMLAQLFPPPQILEAVAADAEDDR